MIIYDLYCEYQHEFEGWFKNPEDLTEQQANGYLSCPVCGSTNVTKKVTAAKLTRKSNSTPSPVVHDAHTDAAPTTSSAPIETSADNQSIVMGSDDKSADDFDYLQKLFQHAHDYIDENFVDVGNKFAEEALSIHNGDKEPENIRGIASKEQMSELAREGVQTMLIPPKPIEKKKLN